MGSGDEIVGQWMVHVLIDILYLIVIYKVMHIGKYHEMRKARCAEQKAFPA